MNAWLIAALVLTVGGLLPCLVRTLYGPPEYRLPGVALAATVTAVVFLLLAQGLTRSSYGDLALVLAVLSPPARWSSPGCSPASAPASNGGAAHDGTSPGRPGAAGAGLRRTAPVRGRTAPAA
ncbi:hypothetical protein ACFQZC_05655 [Streptacidiphilus monticola]